MRSITDQARFWLGQFSNDRGTGLELPVAVHAVAERAMAIRSHPVVPPCASVRLISGQWLTVHAAPLHADGMGPDAVAVTLARADLPGAARQVSQPVLLLGETSPSWARQITGELAAALPAAAVSELPDVGHEVLDKSPDRLVTELERFLGASTSPSQPASAGSPDTHLPAPDSVTPLAC